MVVVSVGERMEAKNIVGASLLAAGGFLAVYGFLNVVTGYINLGIAGMFLGAVVLTFKSSGYVKRESVGLVMKSYERFSKSFVENLRLEGNSVYIPPFENLPEGGVFVPLHEDFEIDLARIDEGTVFLTEVPNDRAMGLFLGPLGVDFVKKYEEHLEYSLAGAGPGEVEAAAGSVLKALGLAGRVYIEEAENSFRVIVQPTIPCDAGACEKMPCPICSSVLLALAKATGELIHVEKVEEKDYGIEISARKLGGVEEWM